MTMTAATAVRCPDLTLLEITPLADSVREHMATCAACRLVVDVIAERARAADSRDADDCEHFDALLAARSQGTLNAAGKNLLARHLASCAVCREVADTVSPIDTDGDHETLPEVDRASYEPGREIGRGGMGRVLEARDLRIGRPVAVKELLGSSPQLAARFEIEARLTARLQHPGIVPIYEIGKWPDGTPFYAMRRVEGATLHDEIASRPQLRDRLALVPSVLKACEAVAFAHSQRVIHRDLKPANILVGTFGETVVIDWGLAKDLAADDREAEAGASGRLTHAGQPIGTYAYMPPEQAHGQSADERSDVFALGAILYHLLAGKAPRVARDEEELQQQARSERPPPIDHVSPPPPRDLATIVAKAMAWQPEDRYRTAGELAAELERFQTGRMVEAHHYSRAELVKRFVARNRAAVTVTLLATMILAVLGAVAVRRILASSADARAQAKEARETARALLTEKGRVELLDGEPLRALAYLHEARQQGDSGVELDLLLGRALIDLGSADRPLECGSDDRHVDVSPDGTLLAAACHDRAKLWRVRDGAGNDVGPTEVATLGGSASGFDNLRFSHDGTRLATWGDDGVVRLWRVGDFAKPIELAHGAATITMASFSGDGRLLSTTGVDGFARIWDVETGAPRVAIPPKTSIPRLGAAFGRIANSELLVLTPALGVGHRYDLEGKELAAFQIGRPVLNGDLSADGRFAVACGRDTTIVLDVQSGKLHADLGGHTDVVWKCVFSADGTHVLTSSHDRTAKVWSITGGPPRLVATANHGDFVWLSRFSPDGRRFFTVSPGKSIKVWDTASGGLLATYDSRGKDGRFLPDGRFAALRGDGRIELWGRTSVRLAAFDPPAGASIVAATPDGDLALTNADAITLRHRSGRAIPTPPLRAPVATTRGRVAAVSGAGVVVIEVETGATTELPIASPTGLELAGNRLAVTWDSRAEIWDVAAKSRVLALPDANRVVLDETGRRAAAWSERESRRSPPVIWDVDRGARSIELAAVDAHPIAFALDGTRLVVVEHASAASHAVSVFGTHAASGGAASGGAASGGAASGGAASGGNDGRRVLTQPDVDIVPALDPTKRWLTTIDNDRVATVWNVADGTRRSRFSGLPLQSAQANADATLLVAIGEYGRAVLVVSPADGRILARHPIAHERAIVMLDAFRAPPASAWWTPDSTSFASLAKGFALWRATHPFTSQAIADVVRKRVPWRVEHGALEKIRDGKIAGRVTRGGVPVANATIEVLARAPADMTDKPVSWESMKARLVQRAAKTDADGRFVVGQLELGELEYRVSASDGVARAERRTTASREGDEPLELELR